MAIIHCPTLKELPPPPPEKSGWPWTEESPQLPDKMPDGSPWPRISIVTPSLNQGQFIEETIRSVLLQGYPDLEYIIIDGGSTNGSLQVIQKYEKWLAYWVSEPDRGQSHAVNKGITNSTGDIIAWLNSDDTYYPSCLLLVAQGFSHGGEAEGIVLYGDCDLFDNSGDFMYRAPTGEFKRNRLIQYWREYFIPQPSVFISGEILRKNPLNESLHYVMDWDLWLRLSLKYHFRYLRKPLAKFRVHSSSKWGLSSEQFLQEQKQIVRFHHKTFFNRLIFHLALLRWKGREVYHNSFRKKVLDTFRLLLGRRIYAELRNKKRRHFPWLSKAK